MTTKFVPSPGFESALARSEGVLIMLKTQAETIAEAARASAPVDTGDYRDGIVAEVGEEGGLARGRVNANDWKSGILEAKLGTLRRAAEAHGFQLTGDSI